MQKNRVFGPGILALVFAVQVFGEVKDFWIFGPLLRESGGLSK